MSEAPAAPALPDVRDPGAHHHGGLLKLTVGAIGIVFGDIGTSPLYAFRETFAGHHPLPVDRLHVFGVLSLIFWSMMIVVTLKYVTILMRADNKGEGGSLALLALISRKTEAARWGAAIVLLGVFACALFYGDSMITPAVSVLSAVEGLVVVEAGLKPWVVPIAVIILVGLFMIQQRGTAAVGALFGPVIIVYFLTLSVLGGFSIASNPEIALALNPWWALQFFLEEKFLAFVALGSVVLAVTGAEALYADMGHFGRRPIRAGWIYFVLPALMINYLGQGALLISSPEAIHNPFFLLAPEWFRLPLVFIATAATVIASQAVISGAFSVTQQAIHLGYIPRIKITHTSASAASQIYIPAVNWALMVMVILLVLVFQTSSNLTAAYGIAVTGAMFIDTCLLAVVLFALWGWNKWLAGSLLALFFMVDTAYFAANLLKVPSGGWFPLMIGLIAFTLLTTWAKGRKLLHRQLKQGDIPIPLFIKSAAGSASRVPGTAVFMTSQADGVPHALLHNLKHNKVLHERSIFLKVAIEDVPYIEEDRRVEVESLGEGFYKIILHFGFMQDMNVPEALARIDRC
ncbi:MAG TPA: KUP/HAK/KT family potassium transporter, partial [Allosphingosinicella sp.]|nr:KUP/HAK/KT family potassium transporter [Allosphingosinicella sp.]